MSRIKKYLFFSQASLLICMAASSLIVPSVVTKEGGISNFGNHLSTVGLYTLGFALNIIFLYLSAKLILELAPKLVYVARSLMFLCFLTLLVFLSTFPRHFSFTFSDIHDYLGITLFGYEFLMSIWIIGKRLTYQAFTWITIEVIGSVIGLLSILKVIHWLYVGQIMGALGFALILILVLPDVIKQEKFQNHNA